MDSATITASIAQVDRMLDRVDKVIGREFEAKPLRPDVSYPRRAKPEPEYKTARIQPSLAGKPLMSRSATRDGQSVGPIASGELTGNEMRLSNGYSPRSQQHDDCDPDGMWANFESEFDDMVAGMR